MMRFSWAYIFCWGLLFLFNLHCNGSDRQPNPGSSTGAGGQGGVDLSGCANGICEPYTCDPHFGVCRTSCETSAECIDGYVCQGGFCFGTECSEANAPTVCGPYACVQGKCAHDCVAGPCAAGYYCRGDTNECVPRCTSRTDPVCAGYVCDTDVGECEPICVNGQLPCAAGYACLASETCVPDVQAPKCSAGCGPYVCITMFDRCATHCVVDADCQSPAVCMNGVCL